MEEPDNTNLADLVYEIQTPEQNENNKVGDGQVLDHKGQEITLGE